MNITLNQMRGIQAKPPREPSTGLLGRVMVTVLVLASFGPYVGGGLRTEQLAVYGLLLTVGFVQLASLQMSRLTARAVALLVTWAAFVAVAFAAGLGSPPQTKYLPGDLVAAVDNLLGPLAVMLVVWSTVTVAGADRALTLAARLIASVMALNGLLAVVMTRVDLSPVLRPFWASGVGVTTAEKAQFAGRFSGVFNQPAEAGIAYGLAALCAWYVWREHPRRMYLVLVPIFLGGLLCVSKVFIFGGLPVVLWLLLRGARTRGSMVFAACAAMFGVTQSGLLDEWIGADTLGQLLRPKADQNLISVFTSGRFGETSTLSAPFNAVWDASPWFGVGIRGLQTPGDNAWLAAFIVAGIFGVVAYTASVLTMLVIARRETDEGRRVFATALWVVIIAGSVGVVALTANRASTLLWVLIALLALVQSAGRSATDAAATNDEAPARGR